MLFPLHLVASQVWGTEEKSLRIPTSATSQHPIWPDPPGAGSQGCECLPVQTRPPAPHPGVGLSSWQRSPLGWRRLGARRQSSRRNMGCQGSTMPSGKRGGDECVPLLPPLHHLGLDSGLGSSFPNTCKQTVREDTSLGFWTLKTPGTNMRDFPTEVPTSPQAPGLGVSRQAQAVFTSRALTESPVTSRALSY